MEFNDYQGKALRTAGEIDNKRDGLLCSALGLNGEAGEFADMVKKIVYHQHPQTHEMEVRLSQEIGDILWYCSLAAHHLGRSLSSIAEDNITKLMKRYPDGFSTERSLNRVV